MPLTWAQMDEKYGPERWLWSQKVRDETKRREAERQKREATAN